MQYKLSCILQFCAREHYTLAIISTLNGQTTCQPQWAHWKVNIHHYQHLCNMSMPTPMGGSDVVPKGLTSEMCVFFRGRGGNNVTAVVLLLQWTSLSQPSRHAVTFPVRKLLHHHVGGSQDVNWNIRYCRCWKYRIYMSLISIISTLPSCMSFLCYT